MNRLIFAFLFTLALSAGPSYGDEKVAINPGYLPETSYTMKHSSVNQITMTLDNPFAAPEEVSGQFPMSAVVDDDREISIATGKVTDEKKFPVTVELTKAVQLLKQNNLVKSIGGNVGKLVGVRFHGTIDPEGNLSLDKMDGKELAEDERKIVIAAFEAALKSMKSAATEPMAIGEKCTKTVPMEIPVPGVMNLGMQMTITYQLMDVKDGIATFDTTYGFTIAASDLSDKGLNIDASGQGAGKIIYDVKKRVQLESHDKLEMDMTVPIDSARIHMTTKTEDSSVTEIR